MKSIPIRLLERYLPADMAELVIGDLVERRIVGVRLWGEMIAALWSFRGARSDGDEFVGSFLADLRHSARLLRRSPGFAAVSIITLALGIGATTTLFSVIEPVLLDPLPYPNPGQLVTVWERDRDGSPDNVGFLTFRDLTDQSRTFASVAVIGDWQPVLTPSTGPERVHGDRVSWNYFRMLGVHPAIGRDFARDEDAPGVNQKVILSHGLWVRAYGADSSVVGKLVGINGAQMTVVGVMPADFHNVLTPDAQIWRVLGYGGTEPFACRTCHHLRMVGRMAAGSSATTARADLDRIHQSLVATYPKEYASVGMLLVPIKDQVTAQYRPALLALAGAVGLMLLIAIANVASMQIARAVQRDEEFAIRTALGASGSRLTRQLLTEGVLLALLGAIGGTLVAAVALPSLVRQLPATLPRMAAIHLDLAALGVVGLIGIGFTLVVGLAAARSRRSAVIADALRGGRRLAGGGRHFARSGLVIAEVALALMLLVGGGLLARTMVRLLDVNAGFDPANLLTLEINAVGRAYASNAAVFQYHDRVREAVAALPGVTAVAVANQLPLTGNMDAYGVHADDKPLPNPELAPSADRYVVSADYLRLMRIPVLLGRPFTDAEERDTSHCVALVSVALANAIWPGESAIGKQIRLGGVAGRLRTVIGVTGNVTHRNLDAAVNYQFYVPEKQWFFSDNQEMLVVRTTGDPLTLTTAIRRAIQGIDPTQPIVKVASMSQVVSSSMAQRRLALALFGTFAVTALLLAIAGLYGILSGRVAEQTREIGLRSALGATPGDILALVVGQGLRLATVGLAIGLIGALSLTRYLQTLLFGVGATDPGTIAAVLGVMIGTSVVASLVPALRAVRVDASVAIRAE